MIGLKNLKLRLELQYGLRWQDLIVWTAMLVLLTLFCISHYKEPGKFYVAPHSTNRTAAPR